MGKKRNTGLILAIISILVVLGFLSWFLLTIFESEKPQIQLAPIPNFLAEKQEITLIITDMKRGLRNVKVSVKQGGQNITILNKMFPFEGLFNREGTHRFETKFSIDPSTLNLAQGRVDLYVHVWDYSRRSGGDGNLSTSEHKMIVDTIPPAIRAVSRLHYVNRGGTGLVVYQTSSDSVKSGLFINDYFFPGFQAAEESQEGMHVCYFGIPLDIKRNPEIYLWAEDKAGNRSKAKFYCRVREKRFRTDEIKITDRFLKQIFPYFSFYLKDTADEDIVRFLKINQDLRRENAEESYNLRTKTSPTRLWDGVWLRLKNAANMARFGDKRAYYYKGKKIDEQVHMGVDLASLANSDVPAANNGRVIFADRLGIYGLTVVLDHGQGLASIYSHLSNIGVQIDQDVKKGEIIGSTGQTGLAGGDHLHFGVMVSGLFVNPIEWWDNHWIQDNIIKKLDLLKR
jgi:murein DD-endopeptidase MepM/ murein hydrolase activator NlpD